MRFQAPLQAPRGTQDLFPARAHVWREFEGRYFALAARYGYGEIRTPMFEDAALFKRTSGDDSDIVTKEMYEFRDRGERDLALKPEGTAPVVRAAIEAKILAPGAVHRFAYRTEIFRYGRQGRGRLRQAHQFGAELLGVGDPAGDAEVAELAMEACLALGVSDAELRINSIGRAEARARMGEALLAHLAGFLRDAPAEERAKIERNPLGALDAKDPALREALEGAPSIVGFLEPGSRARYDTVLGMLAETGLRVVPDPAIVRGLDYYTETVFEIVSPSLPGLSIAGGGRYDDLVAGLGGAPTPAAGFGIGIERAILCVEALGGLPEGAPPEVFVVGATPDAADTVRRTVRALRGRGIAALSDLEGRSLRSQLNQASASGAPTALLIGADEIAAGTVTVRDLTRGEQRATTLGAFLEDR